MERTARSAPAIRPSMPAVASERAVSPRPRASRAATCRSTGQAGIFAGQGTSASIVAVPLGSSRSSPEPAGGRVKMGGMGSAGFLSVPAAVAQAGDQFGDQTALLTRESETTFGELAERTAVAAGAIRKAGITPGERVLLVAANAPTTVITWLAAIHAGALPAAVNPELTPAELDYLGRDLAAAAVIADESRRG